MWRRHTLFFWKSLLRRTNQKSEYFIFWKCFVDKTWSIILLDLCYLTIIWLLAVHLESCSHVPHCRLYILIMLSQMHRGCAKAGRSCIHTVSCIHCWIFFFEDTFIEFHSHFLLALQFITLALGFTFLRLSCTSGEWDQLTVPISWVSWEI